MGNGDNLMTVAKTCLARVDLFASTKPRAENVRPWLPRQDEADGLK